MEAARSSTELTHEVTDLERQTIARVARQQCVPQVLLDKPGSDGVHVHFQALRPLLGTPSSKQYR